MRTESVTLFDSDSEETEGNCWLDEELLFDTKGRLIEHTSADSYIEQEPFRLVYVYDNEGRVIQRKGYDEDGSEAGVTVYAYYSKGNKVEETYYYPGERGKHHILYDHRGNVIEAAPYDADGTLIRRNTCTYTYKTDGNRVEEEYWHKEESNIQITDDNGLIYTAYSPMGLTAGEAQAAAAQVDPEKGTWHKRVITYDDSRRVIEKVEYDSNGELYDIEKYDACGRIIEKIHNWRGEDE